jgi:hypothetical protein
MDDNIPERCVKFPNALPKFPQPPKEEEEVVLLVLPAAADGF